jgi:hypothetical protein
VLCIEVRSGGELRRARKGVTQGSRLNLPSKLLLRSVPCSERCVEGDWNELARRRGNGALPAAWYLARTYAGMRLAELGEIACGVS